MRRRDVAFACLLWGGLLAGLVWALSTQSRWVQESARPVPAPRPQAVEAAEPPEPARPEATGVLGPVSEDTRTALAAGLRSRRGAPARSGPPVQAGAGAPAAPRAQR